jgi:hypothetical protein
MANGLLSFDAPSVTLTMSSREIAELSGSRHDQPTGNDMNKAKSPEPGNLPDNPIDVLSSFLEAGIWERPATIAACDGDRRLLRLEAAISRALESKRRIIGAGFESSANLPTLPGTEHILDIMRESTGAVDRLLTDGLATEASG